MRACEELCLHTHCSSWVQRNTHNNICIHGLCVYKDIHIPTCIHGSCVWFHHRNEAAYIYVYACMYMHVRSVVITLKRFRRCEVFLWICTWSICSNECVRIYLHVCSCACSLLYTLYTYAQRQTHVVHTLSGNNCLCSFINACTHTSTWKRESYFIYMQSCAPIVYICIHTYVCINKYIYTYTCREQWGLPVLREPQDHTEGWVCVCVCVYRIKTWPWVEYLLTNIACILLKVWLPSFVLPFEAWKLIFFVFPNCRMVNLVCRELRKSFLCMYVDSERVCVIFMYVCVCMYLDSERVSYLCMYVCMYLDSESVW
jgi:hypothetical protein